MATVVKLKSVVDDDGARKLESSGLSVVQGTALGMHSVSNSASLEPYFESLPGLVIPYYDLDGAPLKAHPKWPGFYRVRYLKEVKGFKQAAGEKAKRYTQPADTGVCAYFPKNLNWKAIAANAGEPLAITEGELKAAKACSHGFPFIGLGGVHNFRAASKGVFFLPELEKINWIRRKVTIVYDSDYQSNGNICAAINMLAEELQERGAHVFVCLLEDVYEEKDRKTGVDDYIIERGEEEFGKIMGTAEPLGMTSRLWQMNEEVVYVEDPGFIIDREYGQKIAVPNFTSHSRWATANVSERKVRPNGSMSYEKVPAAPVWLHWPLRKSVAKLTYAPGNDRLFEKEGRDYYNQWRGWGVEPVKGDIKPYLELIDFVFAGASKEHLEWFLDWCAYPIKYPGTKLFASCLIHGRRTGTGKTLLFYTLKRIYGENFIKIKNEDLLQTWWLENKQFVLGDEISGSDKRAEADAIKTIITQEEANVNVKFIPQFTIPDVTNYGFTSNHSDAMFLEDEDRRQFVHEVIHDQPLPEEFYRNYDKWLNGDGPAALMHWFLQRKLDKFNPKGPAPRTDARQRMVMASKSDAGMWCAELREHPEGKLKVGQMRHVRDLFTSTELMEMYKSETGDTRITKNGFSRKLSENGFKLAYDGMPIMVNGHQGRYFMIRNKAKWQSVKAVKELAKHIALSPVK